MQRGDNIETLIEKTDILVQRSDSFRVNTKTLERNLWWKNVKIWVILIVVTIFLVWLIFSLACGFDFACLRTGTQCFHAATALSAGGRPVTAEALEAAGLCRVPHRVLADGVRLATSCGPAPLRLTSEHLVAVPRGASWAWAAAGSLRPGDALFADEARAATCRVLAVAREAAQPYYGLNCLHSELLADGVLVSTFGRLHALPALWMAWAGRVLGVHTASRVGDAIASLAAKVLF